MRSPAARCSWRPCSAASPQPPRSHRCERWAALAAPPRALACLAGGCSRVAGPRTRDSRHLATRVTA
eukprot:5202304-Lingulodinium_polyedra.AAC.1